MSSKERSAKTAYLIAFAVLLIVCLYFGVSYFKNFNKSVPVASPRPSVVQIPGWLTFSDQNFGTSFQYPPTGHIYLGKDQTTTDPELETDLQTKCESGASSLFTITRSVSPPNINISNQLTEKITIGGLNAVSSPTGSEGQRASVYNGKYYYIFKFITCDPTINQQVLSTFQFLN